MRKYRRRIQDKAKPADLIERQELADKRVEYLRLNITNSELRVLNLLNTLGHKYIFQYPIFNEWYFLIADFYLPKYKLIVEVDGYSHFNAESRAKERKRKKWLKTKGISVVRIKNKATRKLSSKQLNDRIKRAIRNGH